MSTRTLSLLLLGVITITFAATWVTKEVVAESQAITQAEISRAADRGIEFLRQRGQADGGAFSPETGAAVTGLCVRAILEHRPKAINDPVVKNALRFLESKIQSDGGIYSKGSKHRNYETSVAVGALIRANEKGQYDSTLDRAELFLKGLQWDEDEGASPKDAAYGGAGYGSHERPRSLEYDFLDRCTSRTRE